MELIRISDSKLKVMLTEEDMIYYALDCETMDYDNTETRRAFWQILDEAKRKTGFDAAAERVFVQVYPSKKGGCEMFVTKVRALREGRLVKDKQLSTMRKRESIYAFEDLDTVFCMCERLKALGYSEKSAAYADYGKGMFYLIVEERSSDSVLSCNALGEYGFLSEYGRRKNGSLAYSYIKEHCTCLDKDNAVHSLSLLT